MFKIDVVVQTDVGEPFPTRRTWTVISVTRRFRHYKVKARQTLQHHVAGVELARCRAGGLVWCGIEEDDFALLERQGNEVVTTPHHRPRVGAAIEGRAIMVGDRDDADVTTPPADMPTLPPGLLERGVVVLQDWVWEIQSGDGRDISRDVNNRFSNNIKNAYDICWKGWQYFETNDYPDDQLDWNDKIREIASVASYQAALVTVRVRNWGDGTRRRHRKLEQQLIHLLTRNNISVSLIAAKTQTIGRAVVLPAGQPPVTCENVDLAPYLNLWPQWCATALGRAPQSTLIGRHV